MSTHRVNVNARNVDHWSWSLNGGAETMMPPGSTYVDISAYANADLPADYHFSQARCDGYADLESYRYDNQHYIVRYVNFLPAEERTVEESNLLGRSSAQTLVHEFYCYGSSDTFVTSFGPSSTLDAERPLDYTPAALSDLFKTDICVGYIKWYYRDASPNRLSSDGSVKNKLHKHLMGYSDGTSQHTLDEQLTNYGYDLGGVSNQNYRSYIHPENCWSHGGLPEEHLDEYAISSVYAHTTNSMFHTHSSYDMSALYVINNGATAEHIAAIGEFPGQIAIYPIKKI